VTSDERVPGSEALAPIAHRIDHLVVPVKDPGASAAALGKVLGLTASAPQGTDAVVSSMLYFGNVWIEIGRFHEYVGPLDRVMSLAFEPASIEVATSELERRQLAHGDANRVDGPLGWTTMGVDGLFADLGVFLCEYTFDRTPEERADILARFGRVADSVDDRHRWAQAGLRESGGGVLGIESVREVAIETPDLADAVARWQTFLLPTPMDLQDPGRWSLGDGPALRLVAGRRVAVSTIEVEVASVSAAAQALDARGVATSVVDGELRIEQGLGASMGLVLVE
jgi:hypothetical protein